MSDECCEEGGRATDAAPGSREGVTGLLTELHHAQADVSVEELGNGRRRVTILPREPELFLPIRSCDTEYPLELIERMLECGAPAYLCAEIVREESELYLRLGLRTYVLSYVEEAEFAGARVLDFGCGAGASTAVLARMFPDAEIKAIGHAEDLLSVAELRGRVLGLSNASFVFAATRDELPPGLGTFRHIVLSGVYEHLLPGERRAVLPRLWQALEPGGVMFVNQTPNRLYPLEAHTTNLPLVNCLPAPVAWRFVRRFSSRVSPDESWESLLRGGIRGATRGEIVRSLSAAPGEATLLRPSRLGARDEADIWYTVSMARNPRPVKRYVRRAFRLARPLAGGELVPILHLAVRKH
jgi:2-polyprenyl-3-methyl-5-hydroxy-6-metoxy-1,4-benzoquinol methylase